MEYLNRQMEMWEFKRKLRAEKLDMKIIHGLLSVPKKSLPIEIGILGFVYGYKYNSTWVSPHTGQNGHHQEVYK